jgi:hypothetical protein
MPKKKQFGGGFSIAPSLAPIFNFDPKNPNFAQVADLGSFLGGDAFDQSMAQDDPSIYMNSILNRNLYTPLPNQQQTQQQINSQAGLYAHYCL